VPTPIEVILISLFALTSRTAELVLNGNLISPRSMCGNGVGTSCRRETSVG
jgi:hypothetical protein